MKSRLSIKICLLALFIMLIIAPVMGAMTLSGVKYMEDVAPGATVSFPMTLSLASSDDAADYEIAVLGFGNGDDGSYIGIDPALDTGPYTARPFIYLDKTEVHLVPGGKEVVTAKINTPATGDGGRYALINIRPKPVTTGAGASFTTAINVPVMITLKGTQIIETGAIDSIDFKNVTAGEPFTVTTMFTNTGNHHYYGAQNNVDTTSESGVIVTQFGDPMVTAIMPGETVVFTHTFSGFRLGTYTIKSEVFNSVVFTVFDSKSSAVTVVPSSGGMTTTKTAVDTTMSQQIATGEPWDGMILGVGLIVTGGIVFVMGIIIWKRRR